MKYAYSSEKKHFSLKALCRTFARVFGPAISVASLQSAIIARFASYLPQEQYSAMAIAHKERSWRELIRKIKTPKKLSDADFFAAFILGTIAWDQHSDDEMSIHYRGCLSMWDFLTENSTESPPSNTLIVLGPYALDTLSYCDKIACISSTNPWNVVIPRTGNFGQRAIYFEALRRCSGGTATPGVAEAVHDFMHDMFSMLLTAIVEAAKLEAQGIFGRDNKIAAVLEFVEAELSTTEFRNGVDKIRELGLNGDSEDYLLEGNQRCQVELAIMILRENTILQSLGAANVTSKAEDLIAHFRASFEEAPIRSWYYISGLALAGLALPLAALAQRR